MSLRCACGAALRTSSRRTSHGVSASAVRSIASSSRIASPLVDEASPAHQARREAEQATRRGNLGPFPYVDQPGSSSTGNPRLPWSELDRGEKLGRSARNSTNLLVVAFGLTVTGLVVYAVGSELFSDNSPSQLYDHALEIVQNNEDLHKILLEPIKYHAESSGGRRNRRVRSTLSVDASGNEKMTMHFFAEGKSPNDQDGEGYIEKAKRWIRPIVVEPMHESSVLVPAQPQSTKVEAPAESASSWLGSMFGSLLPSAFASKAASRAESGPPRMRTRPAKGTFTTGEAVATFVMSNDNKFKLDTLTVYYPDARQWQWKTDIVKRHQIQASQISQEQAPNRYRFWSRKA